MAAVLHQAIPDDVPDARLMQGQVLHQYKRRVRFRPVDLRARWGAGSPTGQSGVPAEVRRQCWSMPYWLMEYCLGQCDASRVDSACANFLPFPEMTPSGTYTASPSGAWMVVSYKFGHRAPSSSDRGSGEPSTRYSREACFGLVARSDGHLGEAACGCTQVRPPQAVTVQRRLVRAEPGRCGGDGPIGLR